MSRKPLPEPPPLKALLYIYDPPLSEVNWQSVFYIPLVIICW